MGDSCCGIDGHATHWIDRLPILMFAHAVLRICMFVTFCVAIRFSGELLAAAIRAEVKCTTIVRRACWCVGRSNLHPTHRINGVPHSTPESRLIPCEPPDAHGDEKKDDVEERGVVPREVRR